MSFTITSDDRDRHFPHRLQTRTRRAAGDFCLSDERCDRTTTTGVYDPMTLECIAEPHHLFREPRDGDREPFSPNGAPNPAICHDVRSLHQWMRTQEQAGNRVTFPTTRRPMSEVEKALVKEFFRTTNPDASRLAEQARLPISRRFADAVREGNTLIVRQMYAADPATRHFNAIGRASENGNLELVDFLLGWRGPAGEHVDPRATNNMAIRMASYNGHLDVVQRLLDWEGPGGERVDPRADENFAVRWASRQGHTEVVRLLLEWEGSRGERVDPTARDNYAVQWASREGRTDVVRLLLNWEGLGDERVDPTADDNLAVRWAHREGHTDVVRLLLNWEGPDGERVDGERVVWGFR